MDEDRDLPNDYEEIATFYKRKKTWDTIRIQHNQHNAGVDQKFSQRRRAQSFGVPGSHFLAVQAART